MARIGHKKSRNGCMQCKKRRVKVVLLHTIKEPCDVVMFRGSYLILTSVVDFQCNEEIPCGACRRHEVICSLEASPSPKQAKPFAAQAHEDVFRQIVSTSLYHTSNEANPRSNMPA